MFSRTTGQYILCHLLTGPAIYCMLVTVRPAPSSDVLKQSRNHTLQSLAYKNVRACSKQLSLSGKVHISILRVAISRRLSSLTPQVRFTDNYLRDNLFVGSCSGRYCKIDVIETLLRSGMGKGAEGSDNTVQPPDRTYVKDGAPNLAAWVCGIDVLRVQPFELPPELGPYEVRIAIKAVGICGSDVHYVKHMRCADFVVKEPMVIGHECAGIVEEIGSKVKHLATGDRVALEPGISCGQCKLCKEGTYNLCPEMRFFATPPVHGSLANKVVHPGDLCFKLPDNVSLEEGAMCEPLSVGIHACRRAGISADTSVLIIGAGPIGLVSMLIARSFGAPHIVVADVDADRLKVAKELGADATVLVSTKNTDVDQDVLKLREAMGTSEIDITLDCVGFSKTMTTALKATTTGGVVCLVGMGHTEMTVPLTPAAAREIDVRGVFRYRNTYPLCINLLRTGKINVRPLITHRFGFSQKEVEDAFATSAAGGNAIKVMFNL